MVIIAFGITALVGMVTALSSIRQSLKSNFAEMGANTFKIERKGSDARYGDRGEKRQSTERIKYRQAEYFKNNYHFPARVAIHYQFSNQAVVKYKQQETNPRVELNGVDEHFLYTSGQKISTGRNFTGSEIRSGANVAILGKTLKLNVFGYRQAIGEMVNIGNKNYRVIGVLQKKGTSMGFSGDNAVLIPLNNARTTFTQNKPDYQISVRASDVGQLESAVQEAIGIFRVARDLKIHESNNFRIEKSDNLADRVQNNLRYVAVTTYLIGFITLLGAAIGLMNIMLVSVKERTREIGIRKALGASTLAIQNQFLNEAVMISQIGGLAGIVLGLIAGNGVALYIESDFSLPWGWAIAGFVICLIVGTLAGYYPARRAALMDPIESLRYE